jgi:FkbM family methyltransferase
MNSTEKQKIIDSVIKGSELFALRHSRWQRFVKNPFKTLPLFIINVISKIITFKIKYKTFWGDKLSFYLPEGYAILAYGFFEPNLTNFFVRFLKEDDIFLDIGAHVGYYSSLGSRLVGKNGQVHSFEPTPRTFKSLEQNTSNKNNVTINNRAVMDSETEIEFSDYGPKYSAFNSFKNREVSYLSQPVKIKIKTVSIDKYCYEKSITPTLIKIDAEGAEHIILKAMENVLENIRPIITIEVAGGDEWVENRHSSVQTLTDNNYLPYEATLEGYLTPHKEQSSYEYDNLIFIPAEKIESMSDLIK